MCHLQLLLNSSSEAAYKQVQNISEGGLSYCIQLNTGYRLQVT